VKVLRVSAAFLFIATLLGYGTISQAGSSSESDLQALIDDAAPHSTVAIDRDREIEITRTITISKPLTLVGLIARLKSGLQKTPILSVTAEGVQVRDFILTGNADSVPQEGRAPLVEVRRGQFVIENGETNNSSKDGIMVTPMPEFGDIEHGVVRNITSRGTVRDTVSIAGLGEQDLFVRHIVVENIRAYGSSMRGAVEVSDGSENITVRDVYAESSCYGVDIQDHNKAGQVNRHIVIDGLQVRKSRMAVRTANHDFGHDGLTIRNVMASDWATVAGDCPSSKKNFPFHVRNTTNLLIENVQLHGCPTGPCLQIYNSDNATLRNISFIDGGHDDGPALLLENAHNVLIDNVTVSGSKQPEIGVVYNVTTDDER